VFVFVLILHCAAQNTLAVQVARTALLEQTELRKARTEVLTAVLTAIQLFFNVTPCLLVNSYRSFEEAGAFNGRVKQSKTVFLLNTQFTTDFSKQIVSESSPLYVYRYKS
jgi:hypothetical protein